MSQEMEAILRKSLDTVDRHRKRLYATVFVGAIVLMGGFYRLIEVGRTGDLRKMLALSVVVLGFWMSTLTFVIVLELTIMTKRILRAIELTSKHSA